MTVKGNSKTMSQQPDWKGTSRAQRWWEVWGRGLPHTVTQRLPGTVASTPTGVVWAPICDTQETTNGSYEEGRPATPVQ